MKDLCTYIKEAKMTKDEFTEIIKKCLENLGYEYTDDEREIGTSNNIPRYYVGDTISATDGDNTIYVITLDKKLTVKKIDDKMHKEDENITSKFKGCT